MYCGNCLRDNALVAQWNRLGHDACMVPLYLPLTLDEPDQGNKVPLFFGGVNVFLDYKIPWLWRFVPTIVRKLFDSRTLLKSIGKKVSKTNPADVGALTVSMLQGDNGHQRRELRELSDWLAKEQKPDVVVFSNALLLGAHHHIRNATGAKTVCLLTGEDTFLDQLPEPHRNRAWNLIRNHVRQIDLLIAPSRYYADLMTERLELPPQRIQVVYNGINTEGFEDDTKTGGIAESHRPPTLGFFARMCTDKGLDRLVDAFIEIRRRNKIPALKLKIGGNLNPWNESLVRQLKQKLQNENILQDVQFCPNISRTEKIQFLRSLDVFSVPAVCHEPFGFYVIEALAAGVPVVLPAQSAFPELIEMSGGGVLFAPEDRLALVEALERLFADGSERRLLGVSGRRSALEFFSIERAAQETLHWIANDVSSTV